MNRLSVMIGSGLILTMLSLAPLAAWAQSEPANAGVIGNAAACQTSWSPQQNPRAMDQNVSREIKQAWDHGENATAAMAFQENGEIAMNEGREAEAKQYFHRAEQELATLTPAGNSW